MAGEKGSIDPEVPVVCGVCGTRSYARTSQIGQEVACPDCHSRNRVCPPPAPPPKFKPRFTGDEMRLREVDDPATRIPATESISFTCGICGTLMNAPLTDQGQRSACPDCGSLTIVPPPPPVPTPFQPADASDVVLDAPPPILHAVHKQVADRLMTEATEHVRKREEAKPKPPIRPMFSGVFSFPFQKEVIPIWVGLAVGLMVIWGLVDLINSMTRSLSSEAIMAVFVSLLTTFATVAIAGFCLPPLLSIIEFTADGQNRIPYWPTHDLLDRGRVLLYIINSVAVSSLPGMLLATALRPLGVPLWLGLCSTVLLWPVVLLSMLESDSPFIPLSSDVRKSFRQVPEGWSMFYGETLGLAVVIAIAAILPSLVGPLALRAYLVVAFGLYAVVYCRLLGRLAWLGGQFQEEDPDEDSEEDSEEAWLDDDESALSD